MIKGLPLDSILSSEIIKEEWDAVSRRLDALKIPDGTGGVNPGDRRAIYYLIRHLKPQRALEIGTHIGASTVHILSALEDSGSMVSVDFMDVNCPIKKRWVKYSSPQSPAVAVEALGYSEKIDFVVSPSLDYLKNTTEKFDFIFLDGDHTDLVVYEEIPIAMERLSDSGVILLHDYFPDGQPLWETNKKAILGPFTAVELLKKNGCPIEVFPMGDLPWATKLGSNTTSLAVLVRA